MPTPTALKPSPSSESPHQQTPSPSHKARKASHGVVKLLPCKWNSVAQQRQLILYHSGTPSYYASPLPVPFSMFTAPYTTPRQARSPLPQTKHLIHPPPLVPSRPTRKLSCHRRHCNLHPRIMGLEKLERWSEQHYVHRLHPSPRPVPDMLLC